MRQVAGQNAMVMMLIIVATHSSSGAMWGTNPVSSGYCGVAYATVLVLGVTEQAIMYVCR